VIFPSSDWYTPPLSPDAAFLPPPFFLAFCIGWCASLTFADTRSLTPSPMAPLSRLGPWPRIVRVISKRSPVLWKPAVLIFVPVGPAFIAFGGELAIFLLHSSPHDLAIRFPWPRMLVVPDSLTEFSACGTCCGPRFFSNRPILLLSSNHLPRCPDFPQVTNSLARSYSGVLAVTRLA